MLDTRQVTDDLDGVRERLATRGDDGSSLVPIAALAERRRATINELEALQAERNSASKARASLDKKSDEFATQRDAMKTLGGRIKELEASKRETEQSLAQPAPRLDPGRHLREGQPRGAHVG